jgi:hypothetical protein
VNGGPGTSAWRVWAFGKLDEGELASAERLAFSSKLRVRSRSCTTVVQSANRPIREKGRCHAADIGWITCGNDCGVEQERNGYHEYLAPSWSRPTRPTR